MGFHSVCYKYALLPLAIKEAVSAHGLVKTGRKSEQRYREKVGGVREKPCSCQRRKAPATLLKGHSFVAIHRLIKIG